MADNSVQLLITQEEVKRDSQLNANGLQRNESRLSIPLIQINSSNNQRENPQEFSECNPNTPGAEEPNRINNIDQQQIQTRAQGNRLRIISQLESSQNEAGTDIRASVSSTSSENYDEGEQWDANAKQDEAVSPMKIPEQKERTSKYSFQPPQFKPDSFIPPPEPLLPKTFAPCEPLRSGAPTPFLKLKPFSGGLSEIATQQSENVDKQKYKLENPMLNEMSLRSLFAAEFSNLSQNPVVYNRYYSIFNQLSQPQQNSAYNNSAYQIIKNEVNPMIQLVNVKELIANNQSLQGNGGGGTQVQVTAPIVLPYYTPNDQSDLTLVFESRFESGNLAMAYKLSDQEYNLILSNDINTKGHTQWFFFRVTNTKKDLGVKFNLLNHTKPDSLFNFGMKVLVFSEQLNKSDGLGWHRDGRDIAYYQNSFKKDTVGRSRYFYTLTFTYDFKNDDDTVFFAYSCPYTYSDLNEDFMSMEKDLVKQTYMSRNTLCRTIAGNKCDYVTITAKNHPDQKSERRGVFLSARVHPGETNSSWMMKGIIDFLVGNSPEAFVLREKFVFKIVPMLNPDGVINGNYRCSLSGADLNRRWKSTSKLLYPEIFETKKLCKNFQRERQLVLYTDLHGHSRNKNVFIYGNNYPENPESTRLFPYIMSRICDSFAFDYSRFTIHSSKESTARVSMWRELKIPAVYTMEASFCGPDRGDLSGFHYTSAHYMDIGRRFCLSLLIYCDVDVPKSVRDLNNMAVMGSKQGPQSQLGRKSGAQKKGGIKLDNIDGNAISFQSNPVASNTVLLNENDICPEIKMYSRKGLIAELTNDKSLLTCGSKNDSGDEGGGSDSDPSEDNMEEEEMAKIIPIKVSKKKQDQPKKPIVTKKQFKQEEAKDSKQQTQTVKKPVKKPYNQGGSFFDRVKLPKSFGLRRVEMIDAWTQTSNRSNSMPPSMLDEKSKDQGIQAQNSARGSKIGDPELMMEISPIRQNGGQQNYGFTQSQSPEKQERNDNIIATQSHRSRLNNAANFHNSQIQPQSSVGNSNPLKQYHPNSISPMKNESLLNSNFKDRIQAMQIINQFIKETGSPQKTVFNGIQPPVDPYFSYLSQADPQKQGNVQAKQYFGSPDKKQPMQHQFSFQQAAANALNSSSISNTNHKRQQSSNNNQRSLNQDGGQQRLNQSQIEPSKETLIPHTTALRGISDHMVSKHGIKSTNDRLLKSVEKQSTLTNSYILNVAAVQQLHNPGIQTDQSVANNRASLSGSTYIRNNQKKNTGLLFMSNMQSQNGDPINSRAAAHEYLMRNANQNSSYNNNTGGGNNFYSQALPLQNNININGPNRFAIASNGSQSFNLGSRTSNTTAFPILVGEHINTPQINLSAQKSSQQFAMRQSNTTGGDIVQHQLERPASFIESKPQTQNDPFYLKINNEFPEASQTHGISSPIPYDQGFLAKRQNQSKHFNTQQQRSLNSVQQQQSLAIQQKIAQGGTIPQGVPQGSSFISKLTQGASRHENTVNGILMRKGNANASSSLQNDMAIAQQTNINNETSPINQSSFIARQQQKFMTESKAHSNQNIYMHASSFGVVSINAKLNKHDENKQLGNMRNRKPSNDAGILRLGLVATSDSNQNLQQQLPANNTPAFPASLISSQALISSSIQYQIMKGSNQTGGNIQLMPTPNHISQKPSSQMQPAQKKSGYNTKS